MKKIVECVPNFSEGRDLEKVEKIVDSFRGKTGVKLLDYSSDNDHNRSVVTVVGEPEALKEAVISAVEKAIELIDMNNHSGQHPRMGAVDVIPFIPIKNVDLEECKILAEEVAKSLWEKFDLPIFLYEESATSKLRKNLSKVRKGEYEGMSEKIKEKKWIPDFGDKLHPTAGITAVGARQFLVAYNINLNTTNLDVADKIAKKIRHLGGGLRFCKAMGVELKERNQVQVSMNLTNFTKTSVYQAFEMVKFEADRYGVSIVGSEIVGLVPMMALIDSVEYYLRLENFSSEQILESRIME